MLAHRVRLDNHPVVSAASMEDGRPTSETSLSSKPAAPETSVEFKRPMPTSPDDFCNGYEAVVPRPREGPGTSQRFRYPHYAEWVAAQYCVQRGLAHAALGVPSSDRVRILMDVRYWHIGGGFTDRAGNVVYHADGNLQCHARGSKEEPSQIYECDVLTRKWSNKIPVNATVVAEPWQLTRRKNGNYTKWIYFIRGEGRLDWRAPSGAEYDYTMSYYHDSDFWVPEYVYGMRNPAPESMTQASLKSTKPLLLSGMISNCRSGRLQVFHEIAQSFPKSIRGSRVQLFGRCGKSPLPGRYTKNFTEKRMSEFEIGKNLAKFKFYFSAMNSLCEDYIDEKFKRPFEIGSVPVVYGGFGDRDFKRITLDDPFIHTTSYRNARELAEYLLYLDQNDTAYLEILNRVLRMQPSASFEGWCDLCRSLHRPESAPTSVSVKHLEKWNSPKRCEGSAWRKR